MQPKDIATLAISLSALLVSVFSIGYTAWRGRQEEKRDLRNLLSDAIKDMTSVDVQRKNLPLTAPDYEDQKFTLRQQYWAHLIQANYLVDKVKSLVTPIDYNTLGIANPSVGLTSLAENYYQKSIDTSRDNYIKSIAIASYAGFLFQQERCDGGKDQYEKAISLLQKTDNNQSYIARAKFYISWAEDLRKYAPMPEEADRLFANAKTEIDKVTVSSQKQEALKELEQAKATGTVPVTQPPPLNVSPLTPTP